MGEKIKVVVVHETLFQSILKDVVTFTILIMSLYINHRFLGHSWLFNVFIFFCLFMYIVYFKEKKNRLTFDEGIKEIERLRDGK